MHTDRVKIVEPWTVDGLPYGLTIQHFQVAAEIWIERGQGRVGDDRLGSIEGLYGRTEHLSGSGYDENVARLEQLKRIAPAFGRSHPAILVPDPSPNPLNDVRPVGVVSIVGYVGSIWSQSSKAWNQRVKKDLNPNYRCFWVTSLSVDDSGVWAYLTKF